MVTAEQERNVELARGALATWVGGDREGTLELLADEIEVYVPPELGNAGTYRGRDGFMAWVQGWYEAWAEFEMEVGSIEPVGRRHVIASIHSRGTGAGSGIEVENELGWVLGLRGEFCDYLALQPDLDQARAIAEAREGDAAGDVAERLD